MRIAAFAALAAFGLASTASAAPSTAGRTEFEVLRNGQPFGRHVVQVSGSGGAFSVRSEVNLRVGAGPVTLYRYEQACRETWRDGALSSLECSTLKDGRRTQVSAQIEGAALNVSGADGARDFPPEAWPTTWWTRPPTDVDFMLNTETGTRMPVQVTRIGRETIEVGGAQIEADRYRVRGTLTVDLWYDSAGRWVGCTFTARGQRISYRLASARTAAPA
ncbi:MAG: DUF6134 family protein [Hyphomonadaceae bacterium]